MEKRKHVRMPIKNLSADIADENGFFQGEVSDVSRFGLCMTDLPKRMNVEAKRLMVVVSGKAGHFKMKVRPRWHTCDGARRSVGVEIMTLPLGWTEFVMNCEPVPPEVGWGEIHL